MTASVHLSYRAMLDLDEIETYPTEKWGARVAHQYLDDLGAAIERIAEAPQMLRERPDTSLRLLFYPAREHVMVCDIIGDCIFILALRAAVMDLPRRIAELEPQLVQEAELLAARIETGQGNGGSATPRRSRPGSEA